MAAIEANNDTYCLPKRIEKFPAIHPAYPITSYLTTLVDFEFRKPLLQSKANQKEKSRIKRPLNGTWSSFVIRQTARPISVPGQIFLNCNKPELMIVRMQWYFKVQESLKM